MNLYIVEIESIKNPGSGRKLAVHAENELAAHAVVGKRYGPDAWSIASTHQQTRPLAITFEESWLE